MNLQQIIDNSKNIVFFGGAGVSTESGIPDFRSVDGLYNEKYKYPPETILSSDFYYSKTDEFFDFYRDKMLFLDAKPNLAHKTLAKLEKIGKLSAIVTQNIDGLHQKAGNTKVFELHGSVHRNYCLKCKKFYDVCAIINKQNCDCGGQIKPDVVLYGEGLDSDTVDGAINAISNCDTLIIGGTSLAVWPASSFVNYFKGKHLVVINKTDLSVKADLVLNRSIAEVFGELDI